MRKLNKQFTLILMVLLVSCSSRDENLSIEENVPDLIFGNEKAMDKNLSFEDFLVNAQQLYQSRKFSSLDDYLKKYSVLFDKSDEKKEILILKAASFIGNQKYKEAEALLFPLQNDSEKTIQGKSIFYLAEIFRSKKNYQKALEYYNRAHSILGGYEILSSIADTYASISDYPRAQRYYEQVLKERPDSKQDRMYLGIILFKENKLNESFEHFIKILEDYPKTQEAYQYLALISKKRNNMSGYYYFLSRKYLLGKKYQEVITLLKDQKELFTDIRLFQILISSYIRVGQMDEAIQVYKTGISQNISFKNNIDIKVYHGIFVVNKQEGIKKTVEYFSNLYKEYPDNFNVIVSYSDILEKYDSSLKSMKRIAELYEKALLIEPHNREYRYKLANYYETHAQTTKAKIHFGILFYYQDQYDRALELFLFLEKDNIVTKDTSFYMSKIYKELGEGEKSLKYYKKALALGLKPEIQKDAAK